MGDVAGSLVGDILGRAMARDATAIHLDPDEAGLRVRFRVDGLLVEAMRVDRVLVNGVVGRLKKMADMDQAERRLPQIGRICLAVPARVMLSVATLPTLLGESIALHRLTVEEPLLHLDRLGFSVDALERLRRAAHTPSAVVLFAGPTGSGRHTSAYATVAELRAPEVCVATVEAPVRLRLEGVEHFEVDVDRGLHWGRWLDLLEQQDADVIMLGDIVDAEAACRTAALALRGSRIVGSIHTPDAPCVLTRLLDMGVAPWALAGVELFVQGQRLLRRLCEACKHPSPEPGAGQRAALVALGLSREEATSARIFEPVGCPSCGGTGYAGRVPVLEQLAATPELGRAIVRRASRRELAGLAVEGGMRSLRRSALDAMMVGVTSATEVASCTPARP